MADLSITAAQVLKVSGSVDTAVAGETITAGQPVYRSTSDSKYYKAFANGTDDATGIMQANATGISLHGALAGQPLTVLSQGNYAVGATVVKGGLYVVSTTAGGIAPYADLGTGHYVTLLGVAPDTTHLNLQINATTTRHA